MDKTVTVEHIQKIKYSGFSFSADGNRKMDILYLSAWHGRRSVFC